MAFKTKGIGRTFFSMIAMTALCYASCEVGKRQERDPDFAVFRQGSTPYLAALDLGVNYEIRTIDNDVYIGNLEHQIEGMRALATQEADSLATEGKSTKPLIDKLVDRLTKELH